MLLLPHLVPQQRMPRQLTQCMFSDLLDKKTGTLTSYKGFSWADASSADRFLMVSILPYENDMTTTDAGAVTTDLLFTTTELFDFNSVLVSPSGTA